MYALFGWEQYYPQGGINDFIAWFSSYSEIAEYLKGRISHCRWYSIATDQLTSAETVGEDDVERFIKEHLGDTDAELL